MFRKMFHVKHFPDSHVHPVIKHSSSFMARFRILCSGWSLEIFLTVYVLYPTHLRLQKPLFLINPYQWIFTHREANFPFRFSFWFHTRGYSSARGQIHRMFHEMFHVKHFWTLMYKFRLHTLQFIQDSLADLAHRAQVLRGEEEPVFALPTS